MDVDLIQEGFVVDQKSVMEATAVAMVQTERGKTIAASSMKDLAQIQEQRGKIKNVDHNLAAEIDSALAAEGFEWVYSGVSKTEKAIRGIFYHRHTGYLFRASFDDDGFRIDSWADERICYSGGPDVPNGGRAVSSHTKDKDSVDLAVRAIHDAALICYAGQPIQEKPVAVPVVEKVTISSGGLKSADHVDAINALIAADTRVRDFIWQQHREDKVYEEVPLPDEVRRLGGSMVMVSRGRTERRPTEQNLYASEEDFWKKMPRHWPRFPLRPKDWKRDYRRKVDGAIERRFDLFVHSIFAITREVNNRIVAVQVWGQMPWDGKGRPEVLLVE